MTRCLSALLAAALLAVPAVAQAAEAGVGTQLAGPVDLDTATGGIGHLGVTYVPFTNTVIVSAQGLGATTTAPHSLYEFSLPAAGTANSVLLNTYQQVPTASAVWGHRDGTTDLGTLFITGDENGVNAYDASLGFAPVTGNLIWIANNGPVVSTVAWPLPAVNTNTRALAFNPDGNGGNGSLWTASFGSALVEFDIDGNVLNNFPFNGSWSIYGLAFDTQSGTLWANSSPNASSIAEIDPTTGTETGVVIRRDVNTSVQGGMGIISGAAAQAAYGVESALIGLDQGTPDSFSVYRLNRYSTLDAGSEVQFRAEFSPQGGTVSGTRTTAGGNFTIPGEFQLELFDPTGLSTGLPALTFFNIGPDAVVNGNTFGIPELISVNNLSIPAATPGFTFTIGDGFMTGGLVAPDLGPFMATVGAVTPVIPSPDLMVPGTELRFQSLYFEANAGTLAVNATNNVNVAFESPLNLAPPQGALVEAIGTNNFLPLGNAGAGYWSVTNTNAAGAGGPSIDSISFDMFGSSNALWANGGGNFDYDQLLSGATNGEAFVNGNSALAGCAGTFVGGSDVTTGLAYDVLNSFGPGAVVGPVACDPAAFSGWDTTNDLGGACTDINLRFTSFGPGAAINFDCDTDGGVGVAGGAMTGIVVTIFWNNGLVTQGEIAADPVDPNRGFVAL